jgi:hypothetical protein
MPANLLPIWPWIWLQLHLLLAWIRLTYGCRYLYCWAAPPAGRVVLLWINLESRSRAAVVTFRTPVSPRFAASRAQTCRCRISDPAAQPSKFSFTLKRLHGRPISCRQHQAVGNL